MAAATALAERVLSGEVDACRVGDAPVASLETLVQLADAGRLHEVEGAFQCTVHADGAAPRTTLMRDAIGHRTLFYARKADGSIIAAPRVQELVGTAGVGSELDIRAVASYLSCAYVPGRSTLFRHVHELLPGHTLTASGGTLKEQPFFRLPDEGPDLTVDQEREAVLGLRVLLERTIENMLDRSVEQAAFLSGGIDSSLVVALVQRALGRPIHTFSIAFGAAYKNELEWSSMVAEHVGTRHTIAHLTAAEILAHLDDTHGHLAQPIGDPLTVPNAIMFARARAISPYVWNGEGGDPCFGGPKNLPMVLAELYGDGENHADHESPRARSYYRAHLKCFDELSSLMTPDAIAEVAKYPLEADVDPFFTPERSFVGALSAINVTWKGGHHILPKVHQLAQVHGVLPRSPLFAKAVVEYASRLPPSMRLRGAVEKFALKDAVRDLLPAAIVDRPKSGMMVPVEGWFQEELLHEARKRLLDGALPFDILSRKAVEELVDGKVRGLRPRRGVKIWLLVALESYLRQFRRVK